MHSDRSDPKHVQLADGAATYGSTVEGWIAVLHDEEEDDIIREMLSPT